MEVEVVKNVPCGSHVTSTSSPRGRAVPRVKFFCRLVDDVSYDVAPPKSDVAEGKSDVAVHNDDVASPVSIN